MAEQEAMDMNRIARPAWPRRPAVATAVMTPKEVFAILRRHIFLIVFMTIIGFIIGVFTWFLLKRYLPKYTAGTYIRVLSPVEKDPMTIGTRAMNQQIEYGHRLSVANLIKQQSTLQELLARDVIQDTTWFTSFGRTKDRCILKGLRDLQKHFRAYANRDAEFVELSMTCGDSREAAQIVNEMLHLFLESQSVEKRADVANKLQSLTERQERVQEELNSAERALEAVRTVTGLTDLEPTMDRRFQHTYTLKLNDLELQQNELALAMKQLQANVENYQRLATGPINEQVEHEIESDPVMLMLAQQLALQEAALAGRLSKFGENHKVVRQTQQLIDEIREERRIRKSEIAQQTRQANLKNTQDTLVVLQQRYAELENLRQEAAAQKRDLDLARVQYQQRLAIRDERRQMLDDIKAQIESYRILRGDPETSKVQFVGNAPVPLEVSSPRWEFYFPGGAVLGFMFGVGLCFLIELVNDLVRTPRDVARFLRIPLLSVIPDAAEDEQVRGIDLCHVVRQAPYSIISESYRRLRTNLKLSSSWGASKVLLVSSGMAGDGKTSVAVNLATTFVAEDKKVLLIDANFRRPILQKLFPNALSNNKTPEESDSPLAGEPAGFGLSALLMGLCDYQKAIRPSGIDGLDIIDSGPLPANPAELLGSKPMEELVKQQRENYDYIIIDSPPVLLVSDAKVLAGLVDGTLLVFNAAATRRGAAQRTIGELNEVNATIVGCVLFAARAMKGGYFHEQFRSYQEYQKLQLARSV